MLPFWYAVSEQMFLQQALLAGVLASIGCGVIGPFIIVKRITFLAGGIAHSVLAGLGAAVYYQFDPLLGAVSAAIIAALLVGWVHLHWHTHEDTIIGALWSLGMAIGILFIARTPGYVTDLMSFLFGNILLVPPSALWFMLLLDVSLCGIVSWYYRQFVAIVFDAEFAQLRGIPVTRFYLLLLVLIALTVVLMMQLVGLILVIALLTLPAAIAAQWTRSIATMMLIATLLGSTLTTAGLAAAFTPDLPPGPVIVLLSAALYLLSSLIGQLHLLWQRRHHP